MINRCSKSQRRLRFIFFILLDMLCLSAFAGLDLSFVYAGRRAYRLP
uniref:Lipoprotein signal peptidase n=1 Tax=Bursaphelenchus xylophilus TaxID=6326 RepID=A0A1I7SPD4_BURXY